jgi:hypothetical protein
LNWLSWARKRSFQPAIGGALGWTGRKWKEDGIVAEATIAGAGVCPFVETKAGPQEGTGAAADCTMLQTGQRGISEPECSPSDVECSAGDADA